nr:photosystem II protein X [Meringosphaera mediterranea]WLD05685.1 photosystem II protein X [Meringosphaera mediterranea]WLD05797.1 photosystem II protein X [Meringosphaera mediterranea]WLD06017.1 photosystem II protein X [Meringosphaera mediterranea]
MSPSLVNFTLSLAAGAFVLVAIAVALSWVSSNDRIIRE